MNYGTKSTFEVTILQKRFKSGNSVYQRKICLLLRQDKLSSGAQMQKILKVNRPDIYGTTLKLFISIHEGAKLRSVVPVSAF